MNRTYIFIIGIVVFLFSGYLYIVLGTDLFKFYYNTTIANEPTLATGSKVVISSLMKPKRLDFVCYTYSTPTLGEHKRIHRLVGIPGDTIKIRKGILYVNGKNIDSSLSLMHAYTVHSDLTQKLGEEKIVKRVMDLSYYSPYHSEDSINIHLTQEVAHKYSLINSRYVLEKNEIDNFIYETYKKGWNKDYFGPLFLDKEEYFVLGDNRDHSEDSRTIGAIKVSQLVGKVIRF